jgi:hypothetical protein
VARSNSTHSIETIEIDPGPDEEAVPWRSADGITDCNQPGEKLIISTSKPKLFTRGWTIEPHEFAEAFDSFAAGAIFSAWGF